MRLKALIVASVVMLLLVACGSNTQETPAEVEEAAAVVESEAPAESESEEMEEPAEDGGEAAAESEDAGMSEDGTLPAVDPLEVEGDIVTAGSSTVFPLAEAMTARFENEGYGGVVTIDSVGSGAGFERFCMAGETDISNASRPIQESEIESCREIGREPIEFRVGTDALAVVVSQDNDFVEEVTLEELALIFSTAETWSDVRSEWPDEAIQRYIPGTDSGTFDYFVEAIYDEDEAPQLNASNLQQSEDDNVLVRGVLGSPYSVSYFGYAYYAENEDVLKVLSIDGVEPTRETVDSNEYPLARPLFIYSDAQIMQEKPQVAAFINFFLTYVNEEVVDVGYFPASDEALDGARAAWLAAMAE
ncbi:MAG: PstS family phosphate ABC transporter substrate-binding protein [Chloroflexota bacterium]